MRAKKQKAESSRQNAKNKIGKAKKSLLGCCFLPFAFCLLLTVFFSAPLTWAWTAAEAQEFQKANENYRKGRFEEALESYDKLLREYPQDANLYYNLGNSYFRKGDLGKAILAYERARFFEPRGWDIQENLNYARGLLEYRIEDKRNWYLRAGEKMMEQFTEQEIQLVGLIIYFLFVGSWSFVLFFHRGAPWGWKRKTLLALTVLAFILSLAKQIETRVIKDAIIMTKEAEVRYGPSENDQVALRLGEGLKVYVVDRRDDWSRVILVNGEGGWMKRAQIAEVQV